jgi:hypothetical protein
MLIGIITHLSVVNYVESVAERWIHFIDRTNVSPVGAFKIMRRHLCHVSFSGL